MKSTKTRLVGSSVKIHLVKLVTIPQIFALLVQKGNTSIKELVGISVHYLYLIITKLRLVLKNVEGFCMVYFVSIPVPRELLSLIMNA